ncbi:MAG: hypothetical protein Q7Q73_09495 [Verrucomicrobiota bacterium JB024]|nr:hypothetical protein [Verrucomicrobiota bacterium JB024]
MKYSTGLLTILTLTSTLFATQASAQLVYENNFQQYTPGDAPSGTDVFVKYNGRDGNLVYVVDSSTTPADPFGGVGNKSMYVHYDHTSSKTPAGQFTVTNTGAIAKGTISFDIYIDGDPTGTGLVEVNLGQLGILDAVRASSLTTIQIQTGSNPDNDPGKIRIFQNSASGGSTAYYMDQFAVLDAVNTITLSWDIDTKKVTGTINGESMTIGSTSEFDFTTQLSPDGVSQVRYTSTGVQDVSYFVDNISATAIPEPSHSVLALGALLVLGIGYRRHRRSVR